MLRKIEWICALVALMGCGEPEEDAAIDATADAALDADAQAPDPLPCNGDPRLCDRPFDTVAYLTTHNAMANAADGFRPPNHLNDVPTQLADGARALMLDTYAEPEGLFLCHGFCALGRTPLVEGLQQIRTFLEEHPREVISLIFEAYITPEQTAEAFTAAGLLPLLHTQSSDDPWPTLAELITADHRLIVFSDVRGGPAWHHYVWDFAWETHFDVEDVASFDCAPNRGNPANSLFILNHFITRPFALPALAEEANPTLRAHAERCHAESGRLPNFVTVDFYETGDPMAVVNDLNGL